MARKFLRLVPESATRGKTVFVQADPLAPHVTGEGSETGLCGECGHVLVLNVDPGQLQGVFFRCGKCSAFNSSEGF